MKKLVLILIMGMTVLTGAIAQRNFENNPKVQKLRKAFFKKELNLTDKEASAFWPIFNQYYKEERALKKKYKVGRAIGPETPDAEAEQYVRNKFEFETKRNELKKKYFDKFSTVLPVRKAALVEPTEQKFRKRVLKKVRENRQKNKN